MLLVPSVVTVGSVPVRMPSNTSKADIVRVVTVRTETTIGNKFTILLEVNISTQHEAFYEMNNNPQPMLTSSNGNLISMTAVVEFQNFPTTAPNKCSMHVLSSNESIVATPRPETQQ